MAWVCLSSFLHTLAATVYITSLKTPDRLLGTDHIFHFADICKLWWPWIKDYLQLFRGIKFFLMSESSTQVLISSAHQLPLSSCIRIVVHVYNLARFSILLYKPRWNKRKRNLKKRKDKKKWNLKSRSRAPIVLKLWEATNKLNTDKRFQYLIKIITYHPT